MTLDEVVQNLQKLLKKERLKSDYNNWNKQRVFADKRQTNPVFFSLTKVMERYLTDAIVNLEHVQMQQAIYEHVNRLDHNDLEVSES